VVLDKNEVCLAMAEKGFTAAKLEKEIGVCVVTIRRAMKGKGIQPLKAKQITDALGLSLRDVVVKF
jgi:hypothetical protein